MWWMEVSILPSATVPGFGTVVRIRVWSSGFSRQGVGMVGQVENSPDHLVVPRPAA